MQLPGEESRVNNRAHQAVNGNHLPSTQAQAAPAVCREHTAHDDDNRKQR